MISKRQATFCPFRSATFSTATSSPLHATSRLSTLTSLRPCLSGPRLILRYPRTSIRHYSSPASTSTPSTDPLKKCQFCAATTPISTPVCPNCASPLPIPDSISFYSLFQSTIPPPSGPFTLDLRLLRSEFLKLQQKVHPDNFSSESRIGSANEMEESRGKRLIAESTSSLLNKAYTTLQKPLSRAEHLLALNGVQMTTEGEKLTDGTLLMTVMELREQIEEAEKESDLGGVKEEVKALVEGEIRNLERCFGSGDLVGAKESAVKLRYWLNIQKAAMDWEPGADIVIDH